MSENIKEDGLVFYVFLGNKRMSKSTAGASTLDRKLFTKEPLSGCWSAVKRLTGHPVKDTKTKQANKTTSQRWFEHLDLNSKSGCLHVVT